jgi:hypothetical protein
MLLMCCRLQDLQVTDGYEMTDTGLLEGIGSLHKLTSLHLGHCHVLTAQAWSTFLHRPSMISIEILDLSYCLNLNDQGLKGIAERCSKITYLHV